jgi:hypothetical protein
MTFSQCVLRATPNKCRDAHDKNQVAKRDRTRGAVVQQDPAHYLEHDTESDADIRSAFMLSKHDVTPPSNDNYAAEDIAPTGCASLCAPPHRAGC